MKKKFFFEGFFSNTIQYKVFCLSKFFNKKRRKMKKKEKKNFFQKFLIKIFVFPNFKKKMKNFQNWKKWKRNFFWRFFSNTIQYKNLFFSKFLTIKKWKRRIFPCISAWDGGVWFSECFFSHWLWPLFDTGFFFQWRMWFLTKNVDCFYFSRLVFVAVYPYRRGVCGTQQHSHRDDADQEPALLPQQPTPFAFAGGRAGAIDPNDPLWHLGRGKLWANRFHRSWGFVEVFGRLVRFVALIRSLLTADHRGVGYEGWGMESTAGWGMRDEEWNQPREGGGMRDGTQPRERCTVLPGNH